MIFRVVRTSGILWSKEKPCDEAKLVSTYYIGCGGKISRNIWAVSFESLDELTGFIQENEGSAVIEYRPDDYPEYPWTLEIYDDWRE